MAPSLSKAMGSSNTHPSPLQQAHPRNHSKTRTNHRRNTRPQHTTHQGNPP